MTTNLYKEAIAEARQLREMAEQNAKNKIIDAVTPEIQRLIEAQLLGEGESELVVGVEDIEQEAGAPPEGDAEVMTLDLDSMADQMEPLIAPPGIPPAEAAVQDAEGTTAVRIEPGAAVTVQVAGDGSISVESDTVDVAIGGDDGSPAEEDMLLSTESARALAKILRRSQKIPKKKIIERLLILRKQTRKLDKVLESKNFKRLKPSQQKIVRNYYTNLLREAITLRNQIILTEEASGKRVLVEHADKIFKEIKQMSRRRRSAILDRLFENQKEELDELDAVLTLEPADEEEHASAEDILGDLDIEFELEPAGEEEEFGEEEVEEEGGDEIEVEEEEEVIEIDESMLRREILRMRKLREATEGIEDVEEEQYGGGAVEDEVFIDVDEDTLLNALADELGDAPAPSQESMSAGDKMGESRRRRRRALSARRRRAMSETRRRRTATSKRRQPTASSKKLNEYRKAVGTLRNQLNEMNLFNAKLLYANKLMQNQNVTPKQQRAIVEALDNAKTLREAKLLYKSLTASLNKRSKALTESRRRTLGSASKSTRSGSTLNEGVGSTDRWAVLAGIPGKNK